MAVLFCLNVVEDESRDNKRLAAADAVAISVNSGQVTQVSDFTFLDTDGVTPIAGSIVEYNRAGGGKPAFTRFITVDTRAVVELAANA